MTFKKFEQNGKDIFINMELVSHFMSNGGAGTVLYYVGVLDNEPFYVCVDNSPSEVMESTK